MMTEVNASAAGIVRETGFDGELGNFIRIRHLFGVETVYCHLARVSVVKGQIIILPALSTIGNVGSTGRSTGPHLHFQITIGGTPIPPRFLLFYHGLRKAILGF
jgi:murein DD-endopeptidase MepM/ murein hydrolase activator NlpD